MANKLFNQNKPVKHNGRNGFDLSSTHTFDMRPSVCRPVIVQDTVPNSSYRINCSDLVRTSALQTAAFLRGKHELDFFFVPYSQLFSYSNEIIFGRGDHYSTALNESVNSFPKVPLVSLLYNAALCLYVPAVLRRVYGVYVDDLTQNVEDINWSVICDMFGVSSSSSMNYKFVKVLTYNATLDSTLKDSSFVGADVFHLLSTLGYGDYLQLFYNLLNYEFVQNPIEFVRDGHCSAGDLALYLSSWLLNKFEDFVFEDFLPNVDEVDVSNTYFDGTKYVNLNRLAAYQKVWFDHYRDTVLDDSSEYLYGCNLDIYTDTVWRDLCKRRLISYFANGTSMRNNEFCLLTYLRPHLRMFKKDLSTGLYVSSQYGAYSSLGRSVAPADALDESTIGASDASSAYQIKFTLAMQRYRETLLRAGNRTKDLLMSEFGVKSHYVDDHYSKHIGSFSGSLDLNKVSATSESGSYSVGDLAGNVFSSLSGNTVEYTCNDHGLIIGVMSFISDPLHGAFGVNPFNYKSSQFDYYHEEFENLGLAPVGSSVFTPLDGDVIDDHAIGFGPRYYEYKQNIDTAHDTFVPAPLSLYSARMQSGVNSNYVVLRNPSQTISNLKNRTYMLPDIFDTIFRSLDTGLPENYHFQVILSCDISAVLPMSVLGL